MISSMKTLALPFAVKYVCGLALVAFYECLRFTVSSQIAVYNAKDPNALQGPRFLHKLIYKNASIVGFVVSKYAARAGVSLVATRHRHGVVVAERGSCCRSFSKPWPRGSRAARSSTPRR